MCVHHLNDHHQVHLNIITFGLTLNTRSSAGQEAKTNSIKDKL
jgi:hypothetical protein